MIKLTNEQIPISKTSSKGNQVTSSAHSTRDSLTLSIDRDFPVPGHPHTYKLTAFYWSKQRVPTATTLFCYSSLHTTGCGAVDTCNASFTALSCSISAPQNQIYYLINNTKIGVSVKLGQIKSTHTQSKSFIAIQEK